MSTDFHALITRMANELDEYQRMLLDDCTVTHWLSDEARAAMAQADEPAVPAPPAALPEGYIDPEHSGDDRAMLETFYSACQAEGGTADKVALRGLRAVLASRANDHCDGVRQSVREAIAEAIGDGAYDCFRVWEAWGVGTMGEDDFAPIVGSDERIAEIADAAIDAMRRAAPAPPADGEVAEFARLLEAGGTCPTGVKLTRDHCRRVAALLHRLQELAPTPPADGEVAELVTWLEETGDTIQPSHLAEHQRYKRTAELLQRQAMVPVAVSERLPGPEDCDDQGRSWWLVLDQSWPCLYLMSIDSEIAAAVATHWLPAHALSLPEVE